MLPSQSAEEAEAELKALANQGIFLTDENLSTADDGEEVQKPQQIYEEEAAATTSESLVVSNIDGMFSL